MFILYFGMMSMITPPMALAAFAAANISHAGAMETGWAAMRIGWVAYIAPFAFIAAPALLLDGSPAEIAEALIASVAGVYFISVAVIGFFATPLSPAVRGGVGLAGIGSLLALMFAPGIAVLPIGSGIAIGAALLSWQHVAARRRAA